MNIIMNAARLARKAHEGQFRKYTGRPYVEHPARVAGKVALRSDATEEMVAAAFLHDVLEDTDVPFMRIVEETNAAVGDFVRALTNPSKGSKAPRAERKRIDREHLAAAPASVKVIKMLDRLDNLLEMDGAPEAFRALYAEESILLVEAIGAADRDLAADIMRVAEDLRGRRG